VNARLANGWIVCDGPALGATVEMAVGERSPGEWLPAYRDQEDGKSVVKIRPPEDFQFGWRVWVRVDGIASLPARPQLA
jgi:hypothetical protein